MGWRMKAILGLLIVLEAVNCAQLSLKDARIDDLEGQQIINRCRLENWQTRAMQDEQTIEDLQKAADEAEIALPDGLELVDAGEFECVLRREVPAHLRGGKRHHGEWCSLYSRSDRRRRSVDLPVRDGALHRGRRSPRGAG